MEKLDYPTWVPLALTQLHKRLLLESGADVPEGPLFSYFSNGKLREEVLYRLIINPEMTLVWKGLQDISESESSGEDEENEISVYEWFLDKVVDALAFPETKIAKTPPMRRVKLVGQIQSKIKELSKLYEEAGFDQLQVRPQHGNLYEIFSPDLPFISFSDALHSMKFEVERRTKYLVDIPKPNDPTAPRGFFIRSLLESTRETFGDNHHKFVAATTVAALEDFDIDVSTVKGYDTST